MTVHLWSLMLLLITELTLPGYLVLYHNVLHHNVHNDYIWVRSLMTFPTEQHPLTLQNLESWKFPVQSSFLSYVFQPEHSVSAARLSSPISARQSRAMTIAWTSSGISSTHCFINHREVCHIWKRILFNILWLLGVPISVHAMYLHFMTFETLPYS